MNNDLILSIAQSDYKKNLTEYLKQVQAYVSDIRNGSYPNEVRLATIEVIQKLLIDKLHTLSGDVNPSIDDYR